MGLFGFDSNSAKQTQISATDYAKAQSGKNKYLEGGALELSGKGAKYIEGGAVSLESGATLKTATDLAGAKISGNVVIGDAGQVASAYESALDRVGEIAAGSAASSAAALDKVASKETGEVPWYREPWVWVGVAFVGLLWVLGKK